MIAASIYFSYALRSSDAHGVVKSVGRNGNSCISQQNDHFSNVFRRFTRGNGMGLRFSENETALAS